LNIITETGGLFGLAVRLMQLFSSSEVDMCPLMAILGLYFQIRDDYANLNSKEVSHPSFKDWHSTDKPFDILSMLRTSRFAKT
jgi:geranylgeranyl diphosphate synthase type 3